MRDNVRVMTVTYVFIAYLFFVRRMISRELSAIFMESEMWYRHMNFYAVGKICVEHVNTEGKPSVVHIGGTRESREDRQSIVSGHENGGGTREL